MTYTSTEQERAEFEARFNHLDRTQEPDAWGCASIQARCDFAGLGSMANSPPCAGGTGAAGDECTE